MSNGKEAKRGPCAWTDMMIELLKGGGLAVGVAVTVLLMVAGLMTVGVLGREMAENSVMAACVLGALAGGAYAIRRCARARLAVGVGVGAVEFLTVLLVGAIWFGGTTGVGEMWPVLTACICGGLLAGVLTAAKREGRRSR
ncbi:MAG: TIGR04086 family membrane protein [Oscillospiraceae bacterium]|nr:TIGR04086 family membrane protein [Oscillospiraceae bacterium]